jgi:hypothetical protein
MAKHGEKHCTSHGYGKNCCVSHDPCCNRQHITWMITLWTRCCAMQRSTKISLTNNEEFECPPPKAIFCHQLSQHMAYPDFRGHISLLWIGQIDSDTFHFHSTLKNSHIYHASRSLNMKFQKNVKELCDKTWYHSPSLSWSYKCVLSNRFICVLCFQTWATCLCHCTTLKYTNSKSASY